MKKEVNNNPNNVISDGSLDNLPRYWFLPLALVVAVVPLVCMLHMYDPGLGEFTWFSNNDSYIDSFLYYKSFATQVFGALALIAMACILTVYDSKYVRQIREARGRKKQKIQTPAYPDTRAYLHDKRTLPPVIAMGIFAIVTLMSSFLSEHTSYAFYGGHEQWEGCFVLLSYVVCFFFAFGYTRTLKLLRFLLDALMIGSFILAFLGTLQFFGIDFSTSDWFKELLTFAEFRGYSASDVSATSGGANVSFSTLYNPNYVGSYVPLVLPYAIYLVIRGEKIWRRVLAGLTAVCIIIMMYGCNSDAGKVALAAAAVVTVILLLPYMRPKFRIGIVAGGVVVVGLVAFVAVRGGILDSLFTAEEYHTIYNMRSDGDSVVITIDGGPKLRVTMDGEKMAGSQWATDYQLSDLISIKNEDTGENINYIIDENGRAIISEEGYPALVFYPEARTLSPDMTADGQEHVISVFHVQDNDGYDWSLAYPYGEELLYIDSYLGKYAEFRDIPKFGFDNHYRSFSNRGYIWARVIPQLGKYILTGAGPDNFIYVFPNDDYVGATYWGYLNLTTTRPHNMYLQIWVQDGLIALLAVIFVYGLFMVRVLRMCYRRRRANDAVETPDNSKTDTSGETAGLLHKGIDFESVAIVTAIAASGYMVSGLANDSFIGVAPVFWVMMGVGYAAEAMAHRELTKSRA